MFFFLKKVIHDMILVQTILIEHDRERKIILELETIIKTWIKQLQNRPITENLVKWKNLPVEDVTWEDEFFIQKHP
jgi:hypothetical protein